MSDPQTLLAQYVDTGSETAFRELVTRYLDLVYSTALRQVHGDRHLAEDVSQIVFSNLARKANRLPCKVMLGGWLHRDTCHVAATLMRSQHRREARERHAVEMTNLLQTSETSLAGLGPVLDTAIDQLGAEDRMAILLRFFEQRDFRSVGSELGSSENAARMRVNRALDKLQAILKSHGFTLTTASLAAGLGCEALLAAPVGLGVSIAGAALTGATASGGLALTVAKVMTIANLKMGIIGMIVLGAVATPFLVQHSSELRLREQTQLLRHQLRQLGDLQVEKQTLSNVLAQANSRLLRTDEVSELLKLRAHVGQLREATKAVSTLEQENKQLREALAARQSPSAPFDRDTQSNRLSFIYVSGEVQFPNRLIWTNGMNLTAALEAVHGFTPYADRSALRLTRENGESLTLSFTDPIAINAAKLEPGDKVFVPRASNAPAPDEFNAQAPVRLYTRKVNISPRDLLKQIGASTGTINAHSEQQLLLQFFKDNGITFEPPATAYLDLSNGTLTIRAPLENLEGVEKLLSTLRENQ